MPDLLGDETAWCIFNDGQPGNHRAIFSASDPQGIEISQTIFASSNVGLEDIIFIRYRITNKGTIAESLDSVIFSLMMDTDLGEYNNDLGGTDTLLSSCFVYNDGPDDVYGNNPPAFFTSLLQGPQIRTQSSQDTAYDHRGQLLGSEEFPGMNNQEIIASVINFRLVPDFMWEAGFRRFSHTFWP